jgi:hypothetical protein
MDANEEPGATQDGNVGDVDEGSDVALELDATVAAGDRVGIE